MVVFIYQTKDFYNGSGCRRSKPELRTSWINKNMLKNARSFYILCNVDVPKDFILNHVVPIYYFTTIVIYYRISSSRFYAPFFLPKTRESILNSLGNLQFLRDLQDRSRIMEVFLHLSSNVWYGITVAEEAVHIQAGNTAAIHRDAFS